MHPLVIELGALFFYGTGVVFLHEVGHSLFARLGGFRLTSLGIGIGKPLASVRLHGGAVFYLGRWWVGGACHAVPTGPLSKRRMWYHGGGLILQLILGLFLLLLPEYWLIDRIIQFNLIVAVTNALPWKVGGNASDGWYLLDAVTGRRREADLLTMRPIIKSLAQHQEAVGSPIGVFYAQLCLAWADVLARLPDQATAFFEADPPESAVDPWFDTLYHYVQADWHRQLQRPLAALQLARGTELARKGELHPFAAGLLALAEARAFVDLGAESQARQSLAKLAGMGGAVGNQAAVIHLWTRIGDNDLEMIPWVTQRVCGLADAALLDRVDTALALLNAAQILEPTHPQIADQARNISIKLIRRLMPTLSFHAQLEMRMQLRNLLPSSTRNHSPSFTTRP